MKKIFVTILLLTSLIYAEQRYELGDVYYDKNTKVWYEKKVHKIANGYVSGIYTSRVGKSFTLKNGKKEGDEILLDTDGQKLRTTRYKNGLRNGKDIIWFSNTKIWTKNNYVNGKQEGKSYVYYKSGKLKSISNYRNGVEITKKSFYEDGNILLLAKYTKNYLSYTGFYDSGEKMSEGKTFKSGKVIGKIFYKNGNIKSEFTLYNKDSGKLTTYLQNGNKQYEISGTNEDNFIGYEYINGKKKLMNDAKVYNYSHSREWMNGEK